MTRTFSHTFNSLSDLEPEGGPDPKLCYGLTLSWCGVASFSTVATNHVAPLSPNGLGGPLGQPPLAVAPDRTWDPDRTNNSAEALRRRMCREKKAILGLRRDSEIIMAAYSNAVFKQARSLYFTHAPHPLVKTLTYSFHIFRFQIA